MADEAFTADEVRTATGGWWVFLLIGALSIAVGIVVLFKPDDSLATLAVISGIFLLVDGLLELAASLLHGTLNRGMVALLGVITAIVGVLLIRHPIEGVAVIALLIGIWLITVGVIRIVAAFEVIGGHRGWSLVAGLVELIAGIVIVSDPNIGFATLALLVGIAFIVNGASMLALGWVMHLARGVEARP
jgi:uncharacterized membrane protein HdeD (DUF308 family)